MAKRAAKRAVSPVLATLMMVAVAVAMSVIIFTWGQGFLSQTGEAASAQQASQNVAAQSGILIESVPTKQWKSGTQNGNITIVVRNVGGVSVTLGTVQITPLKSNSGLNSSLTATYNSTTTQWNTGTTGVNATSSSTQPISPRSTYTLYIIFNNSTAPQGYRPLIGDVFTVKVITTAGTFAQGTYVIR